MTSLTLCGRIMYQLPKHKPAYLQEDVMSKKQIVMAVLMIFAITDLSQAQTFFPRLKKYSAADKERLDKTFAACLNPDGRNCIIVSALAVVTMVKLDPPADEFPMIKDRINDLAANGSTPMIRYRASLAAAVFADPAIFKEKAAHQYSDADAFFSALAEGTTEQLLSSK
jgi:hypothetical protein